MPTPTRPPAAVTPIPKGTIMHKLIRRIASASSRHPWRTVSGWLAVMGAVFFLAIAAGGTFVDDFSSPGSQSATALELLDESFPEAAKGSAMVVLAAHDDTTLDDHQDEIAQVLDDVSTVAHVESVADPFAAGTISPDGRIGFAVMTLDAPEREIGKPAFAVLSEAVSGLGSPDLQVELGGDAVFLNAANEDSPETAIGLLVALVVLLVVFGTVMAAVVPIGLALVAVGASIGGIILMASTMDVSVSAIAVSGLVGLGVGIDYSLFVVARYRENRSAGQDNAVALSGSMATAGTAVAFAGGTVMIATAALGITGLGILTSIGLSTALMVLVAVVAAVTLLPALLTLLGDRIDAGRVVRRHRPAVRPEDSRWWRFGHHVSRRPWPYLLGSVAVLATLALPALSIQTAFPAAGDAPAHTTHRQAYDLLTEGFGVGFNAPLAVVMDLQSSPAGSDDVATVAAAIADVPGIVSVGEPQTSADGGTVVFNALPDGGPADPETSATIERVRSVIPDNTYVSGITAITDDLNSQLRKTLPIFVGAVIGISFLLLMLLFRSVAVPLKAAVMNLLSIGAAYGVLVVVFQWGWGAELLGLDGPTPITSLIVVIMFPILFGLSMDYEVFLLSRIREEYATTGDNAESVARGLAGTGRIITSAALIMIAVFLSFVGSPIPSLKMLGLGLATAIAIDATLIRMVLVPATMSLLGDANWWLPRWLDKALPVVDIEADADVTTGVSDTDTAAPRAEELVPR
jgi:putative drug exporter of the RND superfamily